MEDEKVTVDFEYIIKNFSTTFRQYRDILISPEDYHRVLSNKGEHAILATSGSGYSQWYLYHAMDNSFVYIIKSFGNPDSWSWKYARIEELNPKI